MIVTHNEQVLLFSRFNLYLFFYLALKLNAFPITDEFLYLCLDYFWKPIGSSQHEKCGRQW